MSGSPWNHGRSGSALRAAREGFTLVELLVVASIIATLFGLVPALTVDTVGRVALISVACALVELVRGVGVLT